MSHQEPFDKILCGEIIDEALLDETELYRITSQLYRHYTREVFSGDVKWSNRLKTSGGNIRYSRERESARIQINRAYVEKFGKEELIEILKHELTHYYLYKRKKWKHGHGSEFVKTLKDIFKSSCIAAKYNEDIYRYHYYCQSCGAVYKSIRKMHRRIFCSKCVHKDGGQLKDAYEMRIRDSNTISTK